MRILHVVFAFLINSLKELITPFDNVFSVSLLSNESNYKNGASEENIVKQIWGQ